MHVGSGVPYKHVQSAQVYQGLHFRLYWYFIFKEDLLAKYPVYVESVVPD